MYQKIDGTSYDMVFVIGDVHGQYQSVLSAMDSVDFNKEKDLLISVGDLIDRGPESLKCLSLIEQPWFKAVQGNHEEMAYDWAILDKRSNYWNLHGGDWYLSLEGEEKEEADTLIKKSERLPRVIQIDLYGKTVVVAHADYPHDSYEFGFPIDELETKWSIERFNVLKTGRVFNIKGASEFYFGHVALKEPLSVGNLNYIDTGCGLPDGKLTIVNITE